MFPHFPTAPLKPLVRRGGGCRESEHQVEGKGERCLEDECVGGCTQTTPGSGSPWPPAGSGGGLVSDVPLLSPEQSPPGTGQDTHFGEPEARAVVQIHRCSSCQPYICEALQQDTELHKTTKPTTQRKQAAAGHSAPLPQVFLQMLLCGHSAPFTSLTPPCPDFSPLLLPSLLPAVKPRLLCLKGFSSWKSQEALIKRSIVQLFPSLSCIWSPRSLNSSLRKCSMRKEAREDLGSTSQALCARFCTVGNESLQPHKQMCRGAQHPGLCHKEGTQQQQGHL